MPDRSASTRYRVGVDTGGTFTDLVVIDERDGSRRTVKVPSTPARPSDAVFKAFDDAALPPEEIAFFVLGTTIATNALLERKGQRTVLVTTDGFEDVPFIQRINRKSLFDLQWVKPAPYVRRADCLGVRERIAADGLVVFELADEEIERVIDQLRERLSASEDGIAVAVSLLFAYANACHERRLAAAIRDALPEVPLSVSSEVAPIWREYERANTVIVDAYLRRLVSGFAVELERGIAQRGVTGGCFLLKSNGGQAPARAAAQQPANLVLSGLAGGMIAARHFAHTSGVSDVITLDMGGTSADVGVVHDGRVRSASQYEFEFGLPIAVPVIDVSTIGAGGSSIASFDPGGFLKVGPESAGADPGPAAYGRGGERATVTDANLVLGRLNPRYFLGGALPLDPARARAAIEPVAQRLGSALEQTAQAILDVAIENMANAIRLLAADRGLDYRRFALMAFGGAGPLHAGQLARRVGIANVLVPPNPGLASAFGTLVADLRVDRRLTRLLRSDLVAEAELRALLEQVGQETVEELSREGDVVEPQLMLSVSCRYRGQNFEQDVPVRSHRDSSNLIARVVEDFHAAHDRAYGYRIDGAIVELVHVSAIAIQSGHPPALADGHAGSVEPYGTREVYLNDLGWQTLPIYRRQSLGTGAVIDGPAVIEEVDSTTVVLAGQRARTAPGAMLTLRETSAEDGR